MNEHTFNILFISRRNAARSILAEAVVNHKGAGCFRAFSAGTEPSGEVDPMVIDILQKSGYPTEDLHPKHWKGFTSPDAVPLDFVFALCDHESGEDVPPWPKQELTADWQYIDPGTIDGEEWERRKELSETLAALERQFSAFNQLPVEALAEKSLRASHKAA